MTSKMPKPILKNIKLDVLKPMEPSIIELSKAICKYKNIKNISIDVEEVDRRTEKVKILISGKVLDYIKIKEIIEKQGCAIHSIDYVLVENK